MEEFFGLPFGVSIKSLNFFSPDYWGREVLVHRASGLDSMDLLGSDPYCVVSVQGPGVSPKPWKGGGHTAVAAGQNPVWEETFLLEELPTK